MNIKNKKILAPTILLASVFGLITVFAAATFDADLQPIGYVGQPSVSSSIVSSGTEKMYAIDYSAFNWSGNIHSYSLTATGAISNVDDWTDGAAAQINLQDFNLNRKIVTWNGTAGAPFRWLTSGGLTSTQKTDLDPNAATASATSSNILNYIRGDTSKQANSNTPGPYRARTSVLGDIIHSTPVYWNDGTNKTVFVGANDGMLHAINADDGSERFAYIPAVLIPKLSALTVTPYVHKYFVDGRLDVHKVTKSTTTLGVTTVTNQTILAGALGAGGKGLFALDVTNAAATSEPDAAAKVLWEITNTSTGFANLGYTYGAPTLLTLPDGTDALAVGNGYNNTGSGKASLYLINAKTGALIQEFDTGSGSTTSPNGLSSPSFADTNGDGKKDVAYAGDIDGNLWKFDLSASTANPYSAATVRSATKLHTTSPAQAITMAPGMKAHPEGGTMVTFVTGRMLIDADKTNTATHYAYGIWDGAPATNTALLTQTLTESTYTGITPTIRVRTATSNQPNWTQHKGWQTALPVGGERIIGDGALISNSVFVFMSTNPTVSPTALPPGENWWMQLNALTGGDSNSVVFDLNKDGKYSTLDQVNGTGTTKLSPVGRHMGGGIRSQLIQLSSIGFDVYQSNYDKNGVPAPTVTTNTTNSSTAGRGVSNGHFDFDVYCYTNCKDGLNATAGTTTRNTDAKGLKYTHVHEYDDIYDVTGVDMLNPSQALDKLSRVAVNSTNTTYTNVITNSTPTIVNSTKTTVSNTTVTGTPQATNPTTTPNPVVTSTATAPAPVTGFPTTTTSGASTIVTTKTQYTTTQTTTTISNVVRATTGSRLYSFKKTTLIEQWTTTTTSIQTTTSTPTTTTTQIPLPTITNFKVLVANQAYSPAAQVSIGGGAFVNAYSYQVANALAVADIPTYNLANIGTLKFNLPLNAFDVKDWGTGISRAGLHPIKWSCAVQNALDGPLGEWRNGALTFQIVDASITQNDIQLNVAGNPKLGYRLKSSSMPTMLIAEYTTFWHHPNDLCMGNTGWRMDPPQDPINDATPQNPATGSTDPKFGSFGITPVTGVGGTNTTTTVNTVNNANGTKTTTTVVTTVVTNSDGSTSTTTTTTTSTTSAATDGNSGIDTGGAVNTSGSINSDGTDTRTKAAALGRINWRELQR